MSTSMQLKMPSPIGFRDWRMCATCCLPWHAQDKCFGRNWQWSHRSWTIRHSVRSLLCVIVKAGRDGSYNLSSLSVGLYRKKSTRQASKFARAYIRNSPSSEYNLYCNLSSDRTTWKRHSFPDFRKGCVNSATTSLAKPFSTLSAMSKARSRSLLSASSSDSHDEEAEDVGLQLPHASLSLLGSDLPSGHSQDAALSSRNTIGCTARSSPRKPREGEAFV
mmetsp:Transcript_131532/g.380476  ORF Transcript_131532/g.380476 Transcript_131532/m.380476 type:complete len:220 (+) Transcript_131532:420-1079(+)